MAKSSRARASGDSAVSRPATDAPAATSATPGPAPIAASVCPATTAGRPGHHRRVRAETVEYLVEGWMQEHLVQRSSPSGRPRQSAGKTGRHPGPRVIRSGTHHDRHESDARGPNMHAHAHRADRGLRGGTLSCGMSLVGRQRPLPVPPCHGRAHRDAGRRAARRGGGGADLSRLAEALARIEGPASADFRRPGSAAAAADLQAHPGARSPSSRWRAIGAGAHPLPHQRLPHRGYAADEADPARIPGAEAMLVLAGRLRDGGRTLGRGDLAIADERVEHSPEVVGDETCLCLLTLAGGTRFTGRLDAALQDEADGADTAISRLHAPRLPEQTEDTTIAEAPRRVVIDPPYPARQPPRAPLPAARGRVGDSPTFRARQPPGPPSRRAGGVGDLTHLPRAQTPGAPLPAAPPGRAIHSDLPRATTLGAPLPAAPVGWAIYPPSARDNRPAPPSPCPPGDEKPAPAIEISGAPPPRL